MKDVEIPVPKVSSQESKLFIPYAFGGYLILMVSVKTSTLPSLAVTVAIIVYVPSA